VVETSDESNDEEARKEVAKIMICMSLEKTINRIQNSIHAVDDIDTSVLQWYMKMRPEININVPEGIDINEMKSSMNDILTKLTKFYGSACKGLFEWLK